MSHRHKTIEEEHDVLATTHHNLSAVQEEMEDLNELTSATHREQPPSLTEEEEEPVTSPPPPPAAAAAAADGKSKESEIYISLRIHEKVASLASKAYRKASAKSNVLCKDKISGVALVNFEDITVGQLLGKGSFSYVHEITKISSGAASHEAEDDDDDSNDYPVMHANRDQEDHRAFLVANAERRESKSFRYAVKFLKDDVRSNPKAYAIGTVDLVVEGMFLASLTHPNIIKVRALPEGGVRSLVQPNARGYFLVLDRLYDTLSERIYNTWQEQHHVEMAMASSSGCLCLPFGKKNNQANEEERRHLEERLKVAFDISAALKFLHSKSIIYRDIKPENLGFDVRGDIKLFDLGLVKELHPNDRKRDGNYKLSMAGTPRYMAPECGKHLRYNLSADVYSFSMLLWEIVTMTQPLEDFTYPRLQKEVFEDGYRPPLTAVTNKSMRDLIRVGWHQDASKRPSMDTVYEELKKEFQILHGVKMSEKELSHDRRRSTHVPSRLGNVNVSTLLRLSSNGESGA